MTLIKEVMGLTRVTSALVEEDQIEVEELEISFKRVKEVIGQDQMALVAGITMRLEEE